MGTLRRFGFVAGVGAALVLPLYWLQVRNSDALFMAIGSGLGCGLVAALFLYTGRNRPDRGLRAAATAAAVMAALQWVGHLTR